MTHEDDHQTILFVHLANTPLFQWANLCTTILLPYTTPPRTTKATTARFLLCVCELGRIQGNKFCMRISISHCLEYFMEIDILPLLPCCMPHFLDPLSVAVFWAYRETHLFDH